MPRKKKNGRFINYYIDRTIFERLERYADEKGQPMTTALERILEEYLDRYDARMAEQWKVQKLCPDCRILVRGERCPSCGRRWLEEPQAEDYCYLTERDTLWAGVLEDCLKRNGIQCVTHGVLGAGLTTKIGSAMEQVRFFVRYGDYERAKALETELFSANAIIEEEPK